MRFIGALLLLSAATYLLMVGVEGVIIYHEDKGANVAVGRFSAFCIFSALALVVVLMIPGESRAASPKE